MKTAKVIALVGAMLLLVATNPGPEEYREWLRLQVLSQVEAESAGVAVFATILGLDKVAVNMLVSQSERNDFVLFTVYRLTIPHDLLEFAHKKELLGEPLYIVGVLKRFIPLHLSVWASEGRSE